MKEKLKTIDPKAKFILWAKIVLGGKDMTNSTQRKNLQVSPSAPKLHNFYGAIDFKLSGAIPALCEVVKEGFLQIKVTNQKINIFNAYDSLFQNYADHSAMEIF